MAPSYSQTTLFQHDPELELLGPLTASSLDDTNRALKTAPVVTGDAFLASEPGTFPQRAVYGRIVSQECPGFPAKVASDKMYINTNAPFSAVVCGVQGSGKSHSTSVLLESCLIPDRRLGTLPEPLSAIVFHFDTAAGSGAVQPCEAAYVGILDKGRGGNATPPRVTVLVLPSTLKTMRRVYGQLGSHIRVEPLHFAPEDVSGDRLLSMMKVDSDGQMPLYMEAILDILRNMEDNFNYKVFRDEICSKGFNPAQKSMLNLRLSLLDSCLDGGHTSNRATSFFRRGHLTIVDLSSVFMDSSSACGLFDILLGLFIEARTDATGKLVVLDEAHKYLTNNGSSSRLTDSLLSVIRQQRHLGTRVVISTQEPTVVPPQFLDLCSFVIAHRFSSPTWLKHLEQHVSTINSNWLSKVLSLPTGEALVFAPSGVGLTSDDMLGEDDDEVIFTRRGTGKGIARRAVVATLSQGYLHVRSRLRVTHDGGMSIMASDETLRRQVSEDTHLFSPTSRNGTEALASVASGTMHSASGILTPTTPPKAPFPSTRDVLAAASDMASNPYLAHLVSAERSAPSTATPLTLEPAALEPMVEVGIDELRRNLLQLYREGSTSVRIDKLGKMRSKTSSWSFTGNMVQLIVDASALGVVTRTANRVELNIDPNYRNLVDVLSEQYRQSSKPFVLGSLLAPLLRKRQSDCYSGTFKTYIDGAVAAKLVRTNGTAGLWAIGLATL